MPTTDRLASLNRQLALTIAEGGDCTDLYAELDTLDVRPVVAYRVYTGVVHATCALLDGPVAREGEPLHDMPTGSCVLCHKPMRTTA
jgi:hypothetical protein